MKSFILFWQPASPTLESLLKLRRAWLLYSKGKLERDITIMRARLAGVTAELHAIDLVERGVEL